VADGPRYLVTGAAGFIGRRLCNALAGGSGVRALLRTASDGPWDDGVVADLTSELPAGVTGGIHTVFHLAARTHAVDERDDGDDSDSLYRAINVDGTRALLESAARDGVRRFIFFSSIKALGEGGEDAVTDDSVPRPTTAYGHTKLEAEGLVIDGGHVGESVVLRPSLVYGPGVKGNLVNMIGAIDAGRFPPVPPVKNRRTMVHVDDVVAAALGAAASNAVVGRRFIVSDGRVYSTREIYETICRALGKPVRRGLPVAAFRALAVAGDVGSALLRRSVPFDSVAFGKLFGSACYDGSALWDALEARPEWTLERAMPDIVGAFRAQQTE
jgi:UDP-glucose 4-epimerase